MPGRPALPCTHPGCGNLSHGKRGRCSLHEYVWIGSRIASGARVTGGRLRQLRKQLFERQPLCVSCQRDGRVSLAMIRDHVVPLAEGGVEAEWNVQGLCAVCHDAKSREESKRGIARENFGAVPGGGSKLFRIS